MVYLRQLEALPSTYLDPRQGAQTKDTLPGVDHGDAAARSTNDESDQRRCVDAKVAKTKVLLA